LTAYLYDSRLLNDSNRIDFYKIVINDFINNRNIYFGTGTGTFNVYSIGMQIVNNFMIKQWFMWCHSDWLQILYENGIIGILLALYVLVSALIKSRKNLALVSAISAYASAMIFSYPLHYAHTALLACFLILLAFSEKTDKI
jgi:O-antigen ligase